MCVGANRTGKTLGSTKTFVLKGMAVAAPQMTKAQWKAVPAKRKKKDGKGVRFLKVKEGDGVKLVEVRVFAKDEYIKDPVPDEWLR
jgi:hypothetical protein